MKYTKREINLAKSKMILLFVLLINALMVTIQSCTSTSKLIVSYYNFTIDDHHYRIRSVNSAHAEDCYNELITDKFVAVDFDQDQIIDKIVMGNGDLTEAQQIYEKGLQMLAMENKLKPHTTEVKNFMKTEPCCLYEIKSFHPADSTPFNQFRLIENRNSTNPIIIIAIDQNADGTLDEILKGKTTIERIQPRYDSLIKDGLTENKLVRIDGMILIKKNNNSQ